RLVGFLPGRSALHLNSAYRIDSNRSKRSTTSAHTEWTTDIETPSCPASSVSLSTTLERHTSHSSPGPASFAKIRFSGRRSDWVPAFHIPAISVLSDPKRD